MAIKTSSAKAKGRNLQKHVRDRILEIFQLEEGDVESRSMGASGVDIILSPKARRLVPFSIESKKTKKTPSRAELKQSQANAYPYTLAGVVWSPHGSGPDKAMIMFDLDAFLRWWKSETDAVI